MGVKMYCRKEAIEMWPHSVILGTLRRCDNSALMVEYRNAGYTIGGSIGTTVTYLPA
jgi:hypothetical protein